MNVPKAWSLEGRTIVVTGASKGIGKAVVETLLAHAAGTVIFCSRSPAGNLLNELKKTYPTSQIHHIVCDVASPEGRQALVDGVKSFGLSKINGLVNNVGVK